MNNLNKLFKFDFKYLKYINNSISPNRSVYRGATKWANDYLKQQGKFKLLR